MSDVIDMTSERRKRMTSGGKRFAVPTADSLCDMIHVDRLIDDNAASVLLVAPPAGMADGWAFSPDQADRIADVLREAATRARSQNGGLSVPDAGDDVDWPIR